MSSIIFINYFFLFLLFKLILADENRELIFVYEHARHGARGPSASHAAYLNNGVDEFGVYWGTDGELTQIGKRQHYYLGIRNKVKYANLLNFSEYNPMEILIHSTDYNRTHQSIMSELYAMYEDIREKNLTEKEENFNMVNTKYHGLSDWVTYEISTRINEIGPKINKINFPIFNIRQFPSKRIFLVDDCIKLNNYRAEMTGEKVKEFYKEFDENFAGPLGKFMNKSKEYFHSYDRMKSLTDHFICDYDNKRDLSHLKKYDLDIIKFYLYSKRFYGHFIFEYFIDNYTAALEETHLMQDLIGYMDRRIKYYPETTYKAPKMVMDCGHDTTVGPIARFMATTFNIKYHEFCEFACNVYFELYKGNGNTYTVNYYLDDELLINQMDYNEFKKKMQDHFWNESYMNEVCGTVEDMIIDNKSPLERHSKTLLALTIVFSILFLAFFVSSIIILTKYHKLKKRVRENSLLSNDLDTDSNLSLY